MQKLISAGEIEAVVPAPISPVVESEDPNNRSFAFDCATDPASIAELDAATYSSKIFHLPRIFIDRTGEDGVFALSYEHQGLEAPKTRFRRNFTNVGLGTIKRFSSWVSEPMLADDRFLEYSRAVVRGVVSRSAYYRQPGDEHFHVHPESDLILVKVAKGTGSTLTVGEPLLTAWQRYLHDNSIAPHDDEVSRADILEATGLDPLENLVEWQANGLTLGLRSGSLHGISILDTSQLIPPLPDRRVINAFISYTNDIEMV